MILDSDSGTGGRARKEPIDSKPELSDSEVEEEDEEEEDMAAQNLEWLT